MSILETETIEDTHCVDFRTNKETGILYNIIKYQYIFCVEHISEDESDIIILVGVVMSYCVILCF